ncbi:hypothetical protein [Acinetobacter venetianus]|uniref:hypothetical protein n=1 Tax=Acinetobacter venetianus TaxID=52133 RepID=UPI003A8EF3C5
MNNLKGSVLPRRERSTPQPENENLTDEQRAEKSAEFVNNAPLHTAPAIQTNPSTIEAIEAKKVEEIKYPWRENTSMSEDELMGVRQKKSYDIPAELLLRLEYLKSKKKPKGFGQKITESSMILEALDDYTKKELKALGLSVK